MNFIKEMKKTAQLIFILSVLFLNSCKEKCYRCYDQHQNPLSEICGKDGMKNMENKGYICIEQ